MPVYEFQMAEHAQKLEKLIRNSAEAEKPVSFSSLAYWFSFDVMGMFALSESFDMIHDEQWHYAVTNLRRAMSILGPLSPVPWLAQIGFRFLKGYWVVKDWHSMTGWCRERMQRRIQVCIFDVAMLCEILNDSRSMMKAQTLHLISLPMP
jgi:tryprostatin B 6-hydroxylase